MALRCKLVQQRQWRRLADEAAGSGGSGRSVLESAADIREVAVVEISTKNCCAFYLCVLFFYYVFSLEELNYTQLDQV